MTVRSKNSNAITERQLASRPHSRDLAPVDKLRRADDWEDWEDESFEPKLAPAAAGPTTIAAQRPAAAAAAAPEEDKFAGEDEGEDEPVYKAHVPEPQQVGKSIVLPHVLIASNHANMYCIKVWCDVLRCCVCSVSASCHELPARIAQ